MFRPADIVVDHLTRCVAESFAEAFPPSTDAQRQALVHAALTGASRSLRADCLYHNLDHLVQVVQVGQDILRGKILRDGTVTAEDWLHFVAALCLFQVGFSRDLLTGDSGGRCVVAADGRVVELPDSATDARLWPWFADRGMLFVLGFYPAGGPLDGARLAGLIDFARFPPAQDTLAEIATYPGLVRAAHLIGATADPFFEHKLKAIAIELQESGLLGELGYSDTTQFRDKFLGLFWSVLDPLIADGVALLSFTTSGREWLASLRTHLLRREHGVSG